MDGWNAFIWRRRKAADLVICYVRWAAIQSEGVVKKIFLGREYEYLKGSKYFEANGIVMYIKARHIPQQIGHAEQMKCHILNRTSSVRNYAGAPKCSWA